MALDEEVVDRGDAIEDKDTGVVVEDKGSEAAAAEKEAADKKAAEEKAAREKDITIPKAEFDRRMKAERERSERAEAAAKAANEKLAAGAAGADVEKLKAEIDALEDQLEAKSTEGTAEERKALRKQIREKSEELVDARVDAKAAYATALAVEQMTYNDMVGKLETDFPFLNPDAEATFDNALATEVMELKGAFEAAGMASSKALARAIKTLKPSLDAAKAALAAKDPAAIAKAAADAKAKAEKAAEEKDPAKAAKTEAERKEAAVKAAQDARLKQPPAKTDVVGTQDKKGKDLDVSKMSDKDFDALPEAEQKRLRGDGG